MLWKNFICSPAKQFKNLFFPMRNLTYVYSPAKRIYFFKLVFTISTVRNLKQVNIICCSVPISPLKIRSLTSSFNGGGTGGFSFGDSCSFGLRNYSLVLYFIRLKYGKPPNIYHKYTNQVNIISQEFRLQHDHKLYFSTASNYIGEIEVAGLKNC